MTHEEVEPAVLGRGAKLAGVLVIVVAAFAMGFSTGSHHNVNQDSDRQDQFNQALFHQMMDRQAARDSRQPSMKDEVASTDTDPAAARDGE
ncbi:MAG TPA: hypothetical protein VGI81_25010 [Tepidisphaeraceae bacterium]|jgi:hypothetical protein